MSCQTQASDDGGTCVAMSVPFASSTNIKNKISNILKDAKNVNPQCFTSIQTIFSRQVIQLRRKYQQICLLAEQRCAEGRISILEDEDLSKLYTNGKTELVFNGETVETDSYINYTTMASHGFKSMHVYTSINTDIAHL